MAENVVLRVQLSGAEAAISQLSQVDELVNRLKANRNIKITVNARSLTTAAKNAEKLNTNLDKATSSAKDLGTTGAKSMENVADATGKASRNIESFRVGMGSVILNMAKFRIASAAINLVANSFKMAFQEMKAVDSEMVNIRKVTGYTAEEMKKLEKTAYNLASNYGRTASEVLTASTVFARAGYTDQIEQLSELSLLLQNVGDLQADDASKFIIATDKAYKLGGSYESLMAIIDGLDNITNKNATDMQKMTEGMTIAGSVFAESGESVETFAALLGTATANTQRSGSEVARGLRTILMNIRQIRGETEDGELIDGESIAAAAKALRDYADISTMENGKLRKASDVLNELAEKWQYLDETQRSAIAEAVAGKRQANVLMALMGDWGSVQKMTLEYENAAGTAAKENEIYMDSWAAKTEQVKATWTELINTSLETDSIKNVLDSTIIFLDTIKDLAKDDESLLSRFFSTITNGLKAYSLAFQDIFGDGGGSGKVPSIADRAKGAENLANDIEKANAAFEKTGNIDKYEKKLQKILDDYKYLYDWLFERDVKGGVLDEQEQQFLDAYEKIEKFAASIDDLPEVKAIEIDVPNAEKTLSLLERIKNLLGTIGNAFSSMPSLWPERKYASGIKGAPGGPALVNENGPEVIAAKGLAWIAGGGLPTVTMLPQGAQVYNASQTRKMLGGIPAFAAGTSDDVSIDSLGNGATTGGDSDRSVIGDIAAIIRQYRKRQQRTQEEKDSFGTGPQSTPKTYTDFKTLEKELDDILKNLNLQAELAENEEDYLKAMQIYGQAQEHIADLLEKYRAAGYAEDSNEILTLANLGYDYAAKQLGGYDKLQKNLIDALNALTEATEDANALQEKQEAVEKAREALANAENQRTVRIFNPVTGQWEWVANAADVQKAQENLKNAEAALQKEEISQAINAIKNAKPEDLAGMTLSPAILSALFSGTPEQQSAFLNALNGATGGADYLSSAAAQTAFNQGTSIGTQYNLAGVTLTESMAAGMTIRDLIALLQSLKVM